MVFKKIILGLTLFFFVHAYAGIAQEDEDLEIIQIFEILENLDLFEEDIDLLETMTEIGDEDESQ